MKPYFSVVSPIYRAENILPELIDRLSRSLEKLGKPYEIVLVDDRSPDASWDKMKELVKTHPSLKILRLSRNFGQHRAITAGLDHCQGEWVVVMDCDLQDQPEEIERLHHAALSTKSDLVLAVRHERKDSFFKKLCSRAFYGTLSYLCGEKIHPGIAPFGIYSRRVISAILEMRESTQFFPFFAQWVGFRKTLLNVAHAARAEGTSSYNLKRSLDLALRIILSSSDKPLRLIVKAGLSVSSLSIVYGAYVLVRALLGLVTMQGWASLIISIWFWGGLLMATLGVVGLYVGRSFEEGKRRPLYFIAEEYPK